MNLYLREFKTSLKSLFVWCISVLITLVFMMSIYPTFANDSAKFDQLLSSFPEEVLKAFGLSTMNFGEILQFYSYIMTFMFLVAAIYAINLGINALSKEENDKTAEFLLTKPISRTKIITYKLLAALTDIIIYNFVVFIGSYGVLEMVKKDNYNFNVFVLISIGMFLLQLLFLAFGFLLSVLTKKSDSVISISLGTVFAFYGISLLSGIFEDKQWVLFLTPFKYYDSIEIVSNGVINSSFLILTFILVALSIAITYIKYLKRDINT